MAGCARPLGCGVVTITQVRGRRVWDSRGRPTVEVEVHAGRTSGRAIAPAGASTGSGEAVERRDGGRRLGGLDVLDAVGNVNGPIAGALVGLDVGDQRAIDDRLAELDGTATFERLGANATVATSMACAHAAAAAAGLPLWRHLDPEADVLPLPEIQIFGGGAHAGRRIDIQDLMVMVPSAPTFADALEVTAEIYRSAGELMDARAGRQGVADEGGWWPHFDSNEAAIEVLVRAIESAGYVPGDDVTISLDVAASELWADGRYRLGLDGRELTSEAMTELVLVVVRSVSDRLGGGSARRARPRRSAGLHGGGRRARAGRGRRRVRHRRGAARRLRRRGHGGAGEAEPGRHAQPGPRRPRCRKGPRHGRHRLGPVRGERGRDHRPPRRRVGCRPAEGGVDGQR